MSPSVVPLQCDSKHIRATKYTIEPIFPLQQVNANITLLGVIMGRKYDLDFNKKIIVITQRASPLILLIVVIFSFGVLPIFLLSHNPTLWLIGCLFSLIFVLPGLLLVGGTLSYDIFCLLVTTFEFRYLAILVWGNEIIWLLMFRDPARFLCTVVSTFAFQLALSADAIFHMRPLTARCTAIASSVAPLVAICVRTGMTPGQKKIAFTLWGREIELVDVFINNILVCVMLIADKTFALMRLVLPNSKVNAVVCDIYHPLSRLVPTSTSAVFITPASSRRDSYRTLELVPHDKRRLIDESIQMASPFVLKILKFYTRTKLHSFIGWSGLATWATALIWHVRYAHQTSNVPELQWVLIIIGLVFTSIYVSVSAAHYQKTLVARLIRQSDAWLVSFQFTMCTIALCDILSWNSRSLLVWPPWMWCLWVLFLDTLTPHSRENLHYQRIMVITVEVLLILYPLIASYWIYFSNTAYLTDRVLYVALPKGFSMRIAMFSFFASELLDVWIWMCRFLWREIYRPLDALKFIKQKVRYGLRAAPSVRLISGPLKRKQRST